MTSAVPRYLSAAVSDPGLVRENNEDRVYADDVRGFFLVIDGMGGHAAGEVAAEIALERIKSRLERQTDSTEQRIREAITLANNAIYEAAQTREDWRGMACVLTLAVIEDGHALIGHVGDSRLYKIRRGKIEKITHDHSPVGEREDSGDLTEGEAMDHPRRNEVFRDVGSEQHTPHDEDFIEIARVPFEPDSALLLCSDGLSDVVPSAQIVRVVTANAGDRQAAVQGLIAAANEHSKDNVSAVLVTGESFARGLVAKPAGNSRPVSTGRWYWKVAYLAIGLIIGALLAVVAQKLIPQPVPPHLPVTIAVQPSTTISAALDGALPGDTVMVGPGTYRETVRLKNGVDVIAQIPHESVIEGCITADGVERARVDGFQVHADTVGISAKDSNIDISRSEISGAKTAGVRFSGKSRGSVAATAIHDNPGAGLLIEDAANPAIENNSIVSNGVQTSALQPGLWQRSSAQPSITGNIFLANGAEAVWLPAADDHVTQRNYFSVSGKADKRPTVKIMGAHP